MGSQCGAERVLGVLPIPVGLFVQGVSYEVDCDSLRRLHWLSGSVFPVVQAFSPWGRPGFQYYGKPNLRTSGSLALSASSKKIQIL